jgi:hypothetical protein
MNYALRGRAEEEDGEQGLTVVVHRHAQELGSL